MLARVTRFTDYLTRTFNVKGRQDPMSVIPDVFPMIGLVDPTDVEHHYTRNEVLWACNYTVPAGGAGTYARMELKGREGYITVIEGAAAAAGGGWVLVQLDTTAFAAATAVTPVRMDSRAEVAGPPPGVQVMISSALGILAAPNIKLYAPANNTLFIPMGFVIDADEKVSLGFATANVDQTFNVWGYDRPAEDWERG